MSPRVADRGAPAAILDAATQLFREHGVDGLSMRQIAGEIGVSATAIYHHYADKNALMAAVCAAGFQEFGARVQAAATAAPTPVDAIRAVGDAYVDFALTNPMHYDVMMVRPREWALGPTPDGDPPSFAGLVALVTVAQQAGQLAAGNPREGAHQLWAALHGAVSLHLSMPGGIAGLEEGPVRERARAVTEAVIVSLR